MSGWESHSSAQSSRMVFRWLSLTHSLAVLGLCGCCRLSSGRFPEVSHHAFPSGSCLLWHRPPPTLHKKRALQLHSCASPSHGHSCLALDNRVSERRWRWRHCMGLESSVVAAAILEWSGCACQGKAVPRGSLLCLAPSSPTVSLRAQRAPQKCLAH